MTCDAIKTADEINQKAPTEVVQRDMDFAADLSQDETIVSISSTAVTREDGAAIVAGDVVIDSSAIDADGEKIHVILSAGVAGRNYLVSAVVVTTSSQTLIGYGRLYVRNAA